ncbi:monofunctional biosynthetic peptidoglycan transglycosylase [Thalassolituus sp. ST750PaO-4]|uniref:monofunctional biosynthetic peptidoglycan transglycosylase n=1 Tax=Thalassolituus sp. ST750PaO-4 TaxID=2742965 RepID=UPI001CE365F1|nr:monofunctional biosynthetic peptidoglycan transglycosylase [Thalassolituus sp. ST750PaO-4]MCA6061154.1 monofunctional biosynthetic peptidoglycan transglycosylase [Thalassolituus sp. ST750PaO-4]
MSYSLKYRLSYWFNYPRRWLRRLLLLTGALFWLLLLSSVAWLNWLLQDVPDAAQLNMKSLQQQAINRTEQRLEQASGIDVITPQWLPLDAISRNLVYAVVLSEDADFFSHQGIDYDALLAALGENIKQREWKYGASTISQQTTKNLFFDNQKTLTRKFQELVATRHLEQALSKNQILELYLNMAEFGPNLYGIAAASHYYFRKPAAELNAAEGAFLALLLPSPRRYHYTLVQNGNWSPSLRKKMQRILRDMRFKDYISSEQYDDFRSWRYAGLPDD